MRRPVRGNQPHGGKEKLPSVLIHRKFCGKRNGEFYAGLGIWTEEELQGKQCQSGRPRWNSESKISVRADPDSAAGSADGSGRKGTPV